MSVADDVRLVRDILVPEMARLLEADGAPVMLPMGDSPRRRRWIIGTRLRDHRLVRVEIWAASGNGIRVEYAVWDGVMWQHALIGRRHGAQAHRLLVEAQRRVYRLNFEDTRTIPPDDAPADECPPGSWVVCEVQP